MTHSASLKDSSSGANGAATPGITRLAALSSIGTGYQGGQERCSLVDSICVPEAAPLPQDLDGPGTQCLLNTQEE